METIRKVRLAVLNKGMGIREAAEHFNISRNTVRKILREGETKFTRQGEQHYPALGGFIEALEGLLEANTQVVRAKKRSLLALYEELQGMGYQGSYDAVRRYAHKWKERRGSLTNVYVPLEFSKGEAFQFDWSEEEVEINGTVTKVSIAHVRLCYSRMSCIVAYPLERMEMVLDAHVQAHDFFGGLCSRGIYDNLSSVITKVLKGKERIFNARFSECSSHYLFEIDACTPGAGWEKGQVERQVQSFRGRFFTPRQSFSSYDDFNAHLRDRVIGYAKVTKHPEQQMSIYAAYEEEREFLVKTAHPFDACIVEEVRVSSQCLVNFDCNRYSVPCAYANRSIQRRVYAWRVCFYADEKLVAEHVRSFERDKTKCDPMHYLPVLERKPGALRNGRPFREWILPSGIQNMCNALKQVKGGDRHLASILSVMPQYGVEAVNVACELALEMGLTSKEAVLNILHRTTEEPPVQNIKPPVHLRLIDPPESDCARYERIARAFDA